jgi:inhibitor of cysteine peptidase
MCYNIAVKRSAAFIVLLTLSLTLTGCGTGIKNASVITPQLHIKYPIVEGLKDESVQDKINWIIYSTVFKLRDENASALKDHKKDHSYYVRSGVTFDRKNILSVKFEECLSIPFYAHPLNALNAVTVNTKDGSAYGLNDLFAGGAGWKARLNGILKKNIDELAGKTGVPTIEAFKSIDKEQEFYLSNGGLVIYWQEARYFPRYLGPLEVTVKYSVIRDLLRKELKL